MRPEESLEAKCRGIAHEVGGLFFKMNPSGIVGVPDRVVILPGGRTVWVEFKAPFGRLSPVQKAVHAEFEKRGHKVHVVRSTLEFRNAIRG